MDFSMDEIPQEILDEQKREQEEIIAAFQDLRNRIVTIEKESVKVGPIKMKMLEAKPLIEENRIMEAALVKERCEKMLITSIRYRDIMDKLGVCKQTVERSKKLAIDLKRYHIILEQAGDLLEVEEPDTAMDMILTVQEELERLREQYDEGFEQLLKVQKTITGAQEAGMDVAKINKTFSQMVDSMEQGDFSKAIQLSRNRVFSIQNEVRSSRAERDIRDFREELFKAEEEGLVIKRIREVLMDMEDAVAKEDFITFETLKKHIESSINLGNQYKKNVEESLKQTRRTLRQLREHGIWDELVMDIFDQAEDAMKEGDYAFVGECVHYIEPDVKKMTKLATKKGISLNKMEAKGLLKAARTLVDELEGMDVNTRNFTQAIGDAEDLYSKGDYDLLLNLLQPVHKQMKSSKKDTLERLRMDVFALLKKVNGNLTGLRDEGIVVNRFEETMDEVQERIDDGDFRNSWALLGALDDDVSSTARKLETFNELLPRCREMYESLEGKGNFESAEEEYDEIFQLKRRGELDDAISKAGEFLGETEKVLPETSALLVAGGTDAASGPRIVSSADSGSTPADTIDPARMEPQTVDRSYGQGSESTGAYQQWNGTEGDYSGGYGAGYGGGYGAGAGYGGAQGAGQAQSGGVVEYYCSRCNNVLQYITEYEAWWCPFCQRYEGE